MKLARVSAVLRKELLDLRKNRGLFASMLIFPCVVVMVPLIVVFAYASNPSDPSLRAMATYYAPDLSPDVSPARFLIDKTLTDWFGLYLVMPLFVPILISSHSIAGEKERRTLEPLLASPASAMELLLGKSLAAVLPAMAVSWVAFAFFCIGVDAITWHHGRYWLLPNGMWLFGVGVVAPLFAFFGNGVTVLVSARVGETRLAQQLSGLVTLPLLGLVAAQAAGVLHAGTAYYGVVGAVVLVLDVALLWVSVRLFDRERLLTKFG